jgi:hypothetical protein
VPDATDTVDMEIPRIIVIGPSTSDTLTAQQLFADTRNVSPVELLRTTFYHERESPVIARAEGTGLYHTLKEMRRSVRAWVATSIPKAHRAFRRNGIIDMSTRTWLQTRIHTLLPHVQAQRVRIEWYATEATVPFDVVEVALP